MANEKITRQDAFLNAIKEKTPSGVEPKTHRDLLLDAIARGDDSVTPVTREEAYLANVAKAAMSGGDEDETIIEPSKDGKIHAWFKSIRQLPMISFSPTASNSIAHVEWGTGASSEATSDPYTHTYPAPGTYEIVVTPKVDQTTGEMSADAFACFTGNPYITGVALPEGCTGIPEEAFYECVGLTSIKIPESVNTIGSSAFMNCANLKTVILPVSGCVIGDSAFKRSGVRSITIPSYTKADPALPASTVIISDSAFVECASLERVTIAEGNTVIGESAFDSCYSLVSVTLPSTLTEIQYAAFEHCYMLQNVTFGNSLAKVGGIAFQECRSITSLTAPASVTYVGENAFADMPSLQFMDAGALDTSAFDQESLSYYPWGLNANTTDIVWPAMPENNEA